MQWFCCFYLLSVWYLVISMITEREVAAAKDKNTALWVLLAFALLALGDTPHIGLKLLGSALGNLQHPITVLGIKTDFDAFGALATECTFTLFYVCMLLAWKARFNRQSQLPVFLVLGVAAVRFLIMLHPENVYSTMRVREPWFTLRGIPFVLLQSAIAYLILRDALKSRDKIFTWIGMLILLAAACFATVLFFGVTYPALQMLMFPKTMAYLLIGFIAYRGLYAQRPESMVNLHKRIARMKFLKLIIMLLCLLCAVAVYMYMTNPGTAMRGQEAIQARSTVMEKSSQMTEKSKEDKKFAVQGSRRTANIMGYEDTEINLILQKYLEFVPRAQGNLLDLGCAWGFAVLQVLALEKQTPFLKPHNGKIIAIDMDQRHLDQVAANTPPELVETINMHFPNLETQQCMKAFAPNSLGATYAGLLLHYLNPDELTRGLKLLYDATAPGGRVFASVNSAFISQSLLEDFQRRKQNPADPFPGWYPNLSDSSVPEKVRKDMPRSICGVEISFLHVFDEETLARYFEKAGFRVVEHFYFTRNKKIPMKLLAIVAEKEAAASLK